MLFFITNLKKKYVKQGLKGKFLSATHGLAIIARVFSWCVFNPVWRPRQRSMGCGIEIGGVSSRARFRGVLPVRLRNTLCCWLRPQKSRPVENRVLSSVDVDKPQKSSTMSDVSRGGGWRKLPKKGRLAKFH